MMHLSRIDLNLFVVFDAIYTEGGVTRAAERLNLTQPAVSHALARLRETFGDPLFERQGRVLVPTPLARNIAGRVRQTLQAMEGLVNEGRAFDPVAAPRRFVIGMRDVLESVLLPPLAAQVALEAPAVELTSALVLRRRMEAELAAGTIDAALDVFVPQAGAARRQLIARDEVVVVARRDHPELRGGLDLATYLRLPHVLVTSRRHGLGMEDIELRRANLKRRIRVRSQHYFAAWRIVERSDMLLTLTARSARLLARQGEVQVLPFPGGMPPFELYLYWDPRLEEDPAGRWLREQVLRALAA